MDVRLPLTTFGLCLVALLAGCSPGEDKPPAQSLEDKTAQFEKSLDAITDPKLKDAIANLGGSLLLLERAQLKLDSKPLETEYGDDSLALLKHYPTAQALVDTYVNGLFVLRKTSHSDYLTDLQDRITSTVALVDGGQLPPLELAAHQQIQQQRRSAEGIGLLRCALCIRRGQGGPLSLQAGPVALQCLRPLQQTLQFGRSADRSLQRSHAGVQGSG